MAEYIEREALMEHLEERREYLFKENGDYDHYTNGFDEAVEKVENFPVAADVVEVVRCKDCKHIKRASVIEGYFICGMMKQSVRYEDFCSYGDRRGSNDKT